MNAVKKIITAAVFAAACMIIMPLNVKAENTALTAAVNFNNQQYDYLQAQNNYFNWYQQPVIEQYDIAMSNQISQALAAQYQAQIMYQQAMARQAVMDYQLSQNMTANTTNYLTQMYNMGLNNAYNSGMLALQARQNMLNANAQTFAYLNGQALFPQGY